MKLWANIEDEEEEEVCALKRMACAFKDHLWVGSDTQYCLRCGRTRSPFEKLPHGAIDTAQMGAIRVSDRLLVRRPHRTERGFYYVVRNS